MVQGPDSAGSVADRRRARGAQTRQEILEQALRMSVERGLEGLSIGRLASAVGMSKAGLFGHFGSKQELQLATIEAARARFYEQVIAPAETAPAGVGRLRAWLSAYLDYVRKPHELGGSFFARADAEFAGRPGRIRDRLAQVQYDWVGLLDQALEQAQHGGELRTDIDRSQLAFELFALAHAACTSFELLEDEQQLQRARVAMERRLAEALA